MSQDRLIKVEATKGYPAATVTTNVPLREGYAAPASPPTQNVPTTAVPISVVPPPPKRPG